MQKPLALVTGASSGIGAELAVEFAGRGFDLLLTARDAERLEAVAGRVRALGANAEILVLDLGKAADPAADLLKFVGERRLAVLANNAGFGDSHDLREADPALLASMIHLNITVLTLVTRAFVPKLVAQGSGRILQVASTAAFTPVPSMAVYGATKAFVLSFSIALAQELKGTGVTVTALCPGATHTRFAERATLGGSGAFVGAMTPVAVARQGVNALLKGKAVRINGLRNQVLAFTTRFAPRTLAASIAQSIMKKA